MRWDVTFQDPATVYAYSLMVVHHQVMWYMLIILGVVYWSFYRIIKDYNWHNFNKQQGIMYLINYSSQLIYRIEENYNYLLWEFVRIAHSYLVNKSVFWLEIYSKWGRYVTKPTPLPIPFSILRAAKWACGRIALTLHTLVWYYTGNGQETGVLAPWKIRKAGIQELTLSKYWYYSTYNGTTNGYMYSYYNKQYQDFAKIQSYRDSYVLELMWAFFPSVVIFLILVPSLYLLYSLEENLQPRFNIKVIGHQWFWSYEFNSALYDLSFEMDSALILEDDLPEGSRRLLEVSNRLYLPVNVPLRILVTSSDVLHSWAVPEMGIKVDAVPGRLNDCVTIIRRPGVFYGQCSELCGVGHAFMPIVVESSSYKKWLSIVRAI